tara:strand:- start:2998 stop:3108 length:111 start_codon:yes stop_codon:yes gene_type:complete
MHSWNEYDMIFGFILIVFGFLIGFAVAAGSNKNKRK